MRPRTLALLALLLAVGTVGAFGALMTLPAVPVPLRPAWYLGGLGVATALAAVAVWRARRWLTVGALGVSLVLLALAGLFNFVAMRVPASQPLVAVGAPAPDFTLPDAAGRAVTLSDYRGKKPVVLVFYRGYW